jgi:hypothetical protein
MMSLDELNSHVVLSHVCLCCDPFFGVLLHILAIMVEFTAGALPKYALVDASMLRSFPLSGKTNRSSADFSFLLAYALLYNPPMV